jgi:putative phosphoribosyl transferase
MIFEDRQSAGEALARQLEKLRATPDTVVLALPRGGVPVAFEIARALQLPLDLLIVRKLGAPGQPELAIGAIAGDGVPVLNQRIIASLHLTPEDIAALVARERTEISRRELLYRRAMPPISFDGKRVILVDDGLATGATMRAAALAIRPVANQIVITAPVAPASTLQELSGVADEIICLHSPEYFEAVGAFYRNFDQTTDDEVQHLLGLAHASHPTATK